MAHEKGRVQLAQRVIRLVCATTKALSQGVGEAEYFQKICDIVVKIGGYRFCWIGIAEQDVDKTVRPVAQSGVGKTYLEQLHLTWADKPRGRGPTGTAIRTGKACLIRDIAVDPRFALWRTIAQKQGYVSSIAIPFSSTKHPLGALNIYAAVPSAFTLFEVRLLEEVAHTIGLGIEVIRERQFTKNTAKLAVQRAKELGATQRLAHVGNWYWNIRTDEIRWSDEVYRIFGLRPQIFVPTYDQYIAFIHSDDRERLERVIKEAMEHKKPYNITHRVVTRQGRVRTVNGQGRAVYDALGKPIEMYGTVQDVTNLLAAEATIAVQEKEAQKEQALSSALLSSIGDGVLAVDKDGKIIYLNESAERMLRLKAKNAIGKLFYDVWKIYDAQGLPVKRSDRPMQIALENQRRVVESNYMYEASDGYRFPVLVTAAPVMHKQELFGAIVAFHDITAEKRIDRAKSEFISLASHQLRTPLSTIKWYAEALKSGHLGVLNLKQQNYTQVIYDNNERLIELVACLLSVSRIEQRTFKAVPEKTNVVEAIQSVLAGLEQLKKERKIQFNVEIEEGAKAVMVDSHVLIIILQNLVANAMQYTKVGGEAGVCVKRTRDSILIEVWDHGIGISIPEQRKIFTKFFRSENARSMSPDGTGLGLYIVKSVVEASGGSIRVVSKEGAGSKFSVILPTL